MSSLRGFEQKMHHDLQNAIDPSIIEKIVSGDLKTTVRGNRQRFEEIDRSGN